MKILKLLKIVFFLLYSCSLPAQNVPFEVDWGKAHEKAEYDTVKEFAWADTKSIYAIYRDPHLTDYDYFFVEYDLDLNLKRTVEIDMKKQNGQSKKLKKVLHIKGKHYLIWTAFSAKTKVKKLIIQEIEEQTLTLSPESQVVAEVSNTTKKFFFDDSEFKIEISPDSSKILVYSENPTKAKEKVLYTLRVFDEDFKELWKEEVDTKLEGGLFKTEQAVIANSGDVFVSAKLFKKNHTMNTNIWFSDMEK